MIRERKVGSKDVGTLMRPNASLLVQMVLSYKVKRGRHGSSSYSELINSLFFRRETRLDPT